MGFRVPELVILNTCYVVSQAAFPAYARLQGDPVSLRRGYLTALQYVALLTVPAGVGVWFVADDFVQVFYTGRWAPAAPVMQLLALYALVISLSFNTGDVFKATGRPGVQNAIAVLRLFVTIPVLWAAAGSGIRAVALGQLGLALLVTPLQIGLASRMLATRPVDFALALRPAVLGTLAMVAILLAVQPALVRLEPAVRLLVQVAAGGSAYLLVLRLADRSLLARAASIVGWGGRRPAAVEEAR